MVAEGECDLSSTSLAVDSFSPDSTHEDAANASAPKLPAAADVAAVPTATTHESVSRHPDAQNGVHSTSTLSPMRRTLSASDTSIPHAGTILEDDELIGLSLVLYRLSGRLAEIGGVPDLTHDEICDLEREHRDFLKHLWTDKLTRAPCAAGIGKPKLNNPEAVCVGEDPHLQRCISVETARSIVSVPEDRRPGPKYVNTLDDSNDSRSIDDGLEMPDCADPKISTFTEVVPATSAATTSRRMKMVSIISDPEYVMPTEIPGSLGLHSCGISRDISPGTPSSSCKKATTITSIRQIRLNLRQIWTEAKDELVEEWSQHIGLDVVTAFQRRKRGSRQFVFAENTFWNLHELTMMHPVSTMRMVWGLLCTLLIVYDMIMVPATPFEIGDHIVVTVLDWLCSIVWTLDIFVNFRTGYYVGTVLEMGSWPVARSYLRTWFTLDVLVVSLEWVSKFNQSTGGAPLLRATRFVRTTRFVRVVRLVKLKGLVEAVKENFNSNAVQLVFRMTIMTVLVLLAMHWTSCAWFAIGSWTSDGWLTTDEYEGEKDVIFWYLASMRWAIAQLNGRTDMVETRNMSERGCTVFAGIVLAVVVKSIFTSVLTKTLIDLSDLRSEKTKRRQMVHEYLEMNNISPGLSSAVKRYLNEYQDQDREQKKEEQVLQVIPKHVQHAILWEIRTPTLQKHPLFKGLCLCSRASMRDLCRNAIQMSACVEKEVIFELGDACNRMCFLRDGKLLYGDPNKEGSTAWDLADLTNLGETSTNAYGDMPQQYFDDFTDVRPGMWLAEAAIWVEWSNKGRLVADHISYLYTLEAEEFGQVMRRHLDAYASAVIYARRFVDHLLQQPLLSDIDVFEVHLTLPEEFDWRRLEIVVDELSGLAPGSVQEYESAYVVCRVAERTQNEGSTYTTNRCTPTEQPEWYETFTLDVRSNHTLEFTLYMEVEGSDIVFGRCRLKLADLLPHDFEGEIPIATPSGPARLRIQVSTVADFARSQSRPSRTSRRSTRTNSRVSDRQQAYQQD
eukprot:TRINITY_DN27687_c0_g1_i2.p1 TRINITY_DN27687_c0_g1~~TRINITY_DN27687_c0_g1_i2.p1  ORF type:complete len:1012 (+),score=178.75 TRINITY_DN27687_c0_g1_i2:107-3142(+)